MAKPLQEDAKVVKAETLKVGDSIYVPEHWFRHPESDGERFRKIVEIQSDPDNDEPDLLCITPEILPGEPDTLPQWVTKSTLVIVPKGQ